MIASSKGSRCTDNFRQKQSRQAERKGSRSPSASKGMEIKPYRSPAEHDGQYPPDMPMQPDEILLEYGGRGHQMKRNNIA